MIIFLPDQSYFECAKILDYKRLGKQRVEARWLLQELQKENSRFKNHPLYKMFDGYQYMVISYGIAICEEWLNRGYKDTLLNWFLDQDQENYDDSDPWWIFDERIYSSHRTKLITKDPVYYSKFGWSEIPDPNCSYYWPRKL